MNEDFQARQGDTMFQKVDGPPEGAKPKDDFILDPNPLPQDPVSKRNVRSIAMNIFLVSTFMALCMFVIIVVAPLGEAKSAFAWAAGTGFIVVGIVAFGVAAIQGAFAAGTPKVYDPVGIEAKGIGDGVIELRLDCQKGIITVDNAKKLVEKLNKAIEESESE